jgi:hypothetical protein
MPTGILFSILGILLLIYALVNPGARAPLTDANVNLWCGLALFAFGGTLLWLSRRAS